MTDKPSYKGKGKGRDSGSRSSGPGKQGASQGRKYGDNSRSSGRGAKPPYPGRDSEPRKDREDREGSFKPGRKTFEGDSKSGFQDRRQDDKPKWSDKKEGGKPAWKDRKDSSGQGERSDRSQRSSSGGSDRKPPYKPKWGDKKEGDRPSWKDRKDSSEQGERTDRSQRFSSGGSDRKPPYKPNWGDKKEGDKPYKPKWGDKDKKHEEGGYERKKSSKPFQRADRPAFKPRQKENSPTTPSDGKIRLNKYIANSGVCSRREADMLIKAGAVSVNGKIINELGTKIDPSDVVVYDGQTLTAESKVYVLLNKPKDFITTADDPQGRRTVMELVKNAGDQRLFPVGRLDRNTTGLLLLTNDGELTKKLTHPRYGVRKIYHVVLDKALTRNDLQLIQEGVELDGEKIIPDAVEYTKEGEDKTQIGIELHSGQNRVVRRIFENLGYQVEKLDRVVFAGLTKKDLPRGHWRYLSDKEVSFLKMLS